MIENATLIKQGAEARIHTAPFLTRTAIVKERFSKAYRHPILDKKLTARRVNQEARCLFKCRKSGVDAPALYFVDTEDSTIYMEFVRGTIVKDLLVTNSEYIQNKGKQDELAKKIGIALAKVHEIDIIHGDLTTSNLMLRESNQSLVVIDFGLSYISSLPEDKAVDLYVLERAFLSTHPNSEEMFTEILDNYQKTYNASQWVLSKLAEDYGDEREVWNVQCGTQGKVIHRASMFKLNEEVTLASTIMSSSRSYNTKVFYGPPKCEPERSEEIIEKGCDMEYWSDPVGVKKIER
ncbi:5996_t:CDS:10 [Funneliformis geosporum]|uniref:non-specific serine/threonine protein kinase n=1 Tax=Funneliformis geosporum TaxID=1117311 RepID=A0A9W4SEH0_9GLOM|nr:8646_t:CDS:10 [Funneliformis geosporum]CAI2166263.1 5996_t:CDS:10 [Funneliformis geosporum]